MWNIIEYEEVGSTNTVAMERLFRGEAKHGDVIVAKHQSSGRGRSPGRVWNDERDASLLMSVVLLEISNPQQLLQYRMALAVLDTLRSLAPEHSQHVLLKWPNDILIGEKKVSGLLVEAEWNGAAMKSAVVGIGVNVRQRSFDRSLADIATSLLLEGTDVSVSFLRDNILKSIERELHHSSLEQVLARLRQELSWMAAISSFELVTENGQRLCDVRFAGIDDSGTMRMIDGKGQSLEVRNGSLAWNKQNR